MSAGSDVPGKMERMVCIRILTISLLKCVRESTIINILRICKMDYQNEKRRIP